MLSNLVISKTILFLGLFYVSRVYCDQSDDFFVKRTKTKFSLDITGCMVLEKPCSHLEEDVPLLSCSLSVAHSNRTQVPATCQQKLWTYQADMLSSAYLNFKLGDLCQKEPLILDCLGQNGLVLDCILKKKPSVRDRKCWLMINKIESLIFNDWQIVKNFLNYCMSDIQTHSCGKISTDIKSLSQTATLKCLQNVQKLGSDCENEINTLKEIKYGTLQLDKVVFAACMSEQKSFCPDEIPGTWLMYKCLIRHKYETGMTRQCQDQLLFDQRTMVMNYRNSKGFVRACKEDIRKYHCRKGVVEDKDVRLAQILLCLENVSRNETATLTPECTTEMTDHRKMLMDDYRLSPELMQNCANDIKTFCKGIEAGGKTIHCLMDHTRSRRRRDRRISADCQRSLEILVESADPGEDWRVDPVLRKACKPVVDRACGEVTGGNGRVMSCLMEKLGTNLMSTECETALLQIQYFISRDFRLDPQLYKACKYDAVTNCKARMQWADTNEHPSEKDPLVFPCLYNYAYNTNILKQVCKTQVKRVMRQRAISVDLLPAIEDNCIEDLANLCFENTGKGEEISCLQNKIKELSPKCKDAITNFTETQSGHIELNAVVNLNCRVSIDRLCPSESKSKKSDEDDVMECLIAHKNDPEIKSNMKCRAAIEHEQLIALKNYRFTRKFKNACKTSVVRFCPNAQTKNQVVICLSEIVRNDTITTKKHSISKECRQQLRSQLFQQKENIDLDPELQDACKKDLKTFCENVPHGEAAALECLKAANSKLSAGCKKAMFVVKKQIFTDNGIDFHLMTTCNDMIDMYCHNFDVTKMLDCLKVHKDEKDFEEQCKLVVINRMIDQNTDYRLNNNLQNSCKMDIDKFCKDVIASKPQDVELEGKVLYCLKEKFRQSKLTDTCETELANILKEQALNYRLDPLLGRLCKAEIQTICAVSDDSMTKSDGQVEECLKQALLNHKIVSAECAREVVQIIEETEADIDADPLLENACTFDLLKYCKDLEHGAGRRLKCLKIILNDSNRKLEPKCEKELSNRLEMYRYVAAASMVDLGDVYNELSSSPSKKYFLLVAFSIIGLIFIFGLYCGRVTKKAMYIKRK